MGWRASLIGCGFVALALSATLANSAEDISKTRSDINGITKRLNALDAWFSSASKRQRDLQRDLRSTDRSIATANTDIDAIEKQLGAITTELSDLAARKQALAQQRDEQAQHIASHLAAAYRLSGEDYVKLLLNQQNPELIERLMRYHRYFTAARVEAIDAYQRTLDEIDVNTKATTERQNALAQQQRDLDAQRTTLRTQRAKRETVLVALNSEMQGKAEERTRLTEDRQRLQSLLAELQRRAQRSVSTTFARAKGKLPWPAAGKLVHRFGDQRSGGLLTWQGIFIDAPEGTPVAAVHAGKVAFSDWLRGFGLLTIIDHGSGYMSLYAHSDALYKKVGDEVAAGETIASTGRSGGPSESGLYFEIRSNGAATDPLAWLARR